MTIQVAVGIAGFNAGGGGTDPGGGGGTTDPTPVNPIAVTLSSPDDQATVADSTPTFIVGVDTSLEDPQASYTLHLQYAATQDMASPTELTADFTAVEAGAYLTPASAVPATTWWRARVAQGTVWRSAWTDPQSFSVNTTVTASSVPVTWTVSSNATVGRRIHVWYILPSAAYPGDKVTVYGEGLPDSPGSVWVGPVKATVVSWTFIAQQGNPDDTRHITGDDITPEHYEVVITVPSISPPGAALEVTT